MGDSIAYKSLYFAPEPFLIEASEIVVFKMSALGAALFDRIAIRKARDLETGLNRECLDLLLKVLHEDMHRPVDLARLPEPGHPQSRSVMDFIERNYAKKLTMSDFTAALPYCGRHLARLFKADVKVGIFQYLRLYRILMASIGLSVSSRSITEVAYDSGYESITSFYRDFNLVYALSPKVFRDRMRSPEK